MVSRRVFVGTAVAAAAKPDEGWKTLTAPEAGLLEAVCDQVVPEDDTPGAKQAGVIHYIDRQLAGPLLRFRESYRQGLPLLDQAARKLLGSPFLDLGAGERTALLERVERGEAGPEAAAFFRLVIHHTLQGYYGSPSHGGNRGEASWRMLGIEKHMHEGHQ
ncbi:MAG: gluconate 2-dehydrogenase subunit 3 family protein [Bryobacteraceae bacterium]|nr:gluconate 2-dehydrogenase subunit 3 family protein [Bryobacteraceae bacterium]